MCGIAGLHLRDPLLYPQLGFYLSGMLAQAAGRGNDAAGVGLYANPDTVPAARATVSALVSGITPGAAAALLAAKSDPSTEIAVAQFGQTMVFTAEMPPGELEAAITEAIENAVIISRGNTLTVLKGTGEPEKLAENWQLGQRGGWQGVAHTRMATESAVVPGGSHPFSVGPDQCLIHNGSFSNHESVRKNLARQGISFDSQNDTEVAARFVARQLADGATMAEALKALTEVFDGFYTLLVSSATSFAVVRDPISCKPAIIAETPQYVAVASEYRYLTGLPNIETARIFEPEPEVVYAWERNLLPAQPALT